MKLDILLAGTTCVDVTSEKFNFIEDIAGDGLVIDSSRMPTNMNFFKEGTVSGGGTLNIAPLISIAGGNVGILTYLGKGVHKGLDICGNFIYNLLLKYKINTDGILLHDKMPTSVSFIKPSDDGRDAILHCPNAVDQLNLLKRKIYNRILSLRPWIFYHLYLGCIKEMDKNDRIAKLFKKLQFENIITMVDTHTFSKNPKESIKKKEKIKKYEPLKKVLKYTNIFFSSYEEAMMISNTFGYSISKIEDFLKILVEEFFDEEIKLFGVTDGLDVYSVYGNKKEVFGPLHIRSNYFVKPESLVGAGDSFRAGVLLYLLKNKEEFEKNKLNLREAINMGNLISSLYISAPKENRYTNIKHYSSLIAEIRKNR